MEGMGIFKKAPDIDFTDMQKRGLIRKQLEQQENKLKVNSQGFIEFNQGTNASSSTGISPSQDSSASPFGFLDTFASNAGTTQTTTDVVPVVSQNVQTPDFANIGFKVENLDYKLGVLTERLEKIESKLLDFENKSQGFRL